MKPGCDACGAKKDLAELSLYGLRRTLCNKCYCARYSVGTRESIEAHVRQWDRDHPVRNTGLELRQTEFDLGENEWGNTSRKRRSSGRSSRS